MKSIEIKDLTLKRFPDYIDIYLTFKCLDFDFLKFFLDECPLYIEDTFISDPKLHEQWYMDLELTQQHNGFITRNSTIEESQVFLKGWKINEINISLVEEPNVFYYAGGLRNNKIVESILEEMKNDFITAFDFYSCLCSLQYWLN